MIRETFEKIMKSRLSLTVLIIILAFGVTPIKSQPFFIGEIEGGPSLAYIFGNTTSKDYIKPILGGFAGINFIYGFSKHFSIKTGLAYERKGADLLINSSIKLNYTFHFDYISMPILMKASFGKKVRFIATAGPSISYLIKQSYINNDYKSCTWDWPEPDQATFNDKNNFDLGLIFGVGVEFSINKYFSINFECLDNYGLTNTKLFPVFVSPDGTQYNNDRTLKNNSAIITIGFLYSFGSEKEK